jgi:hypothetical protein
MKYKLAILLTVIAFLSCKKKETTSTTNQTAAPVNAGFTFSTWDVNGNRITTNNTTNTFIITFSQNNNLVYSIKVRNSTNFNIANFKDGGYIYEITDSLGLFGYTRDSIVSKNGSVYLGRSQPSSPGSWSSGSIDLGSVQIKPTFALVNYTITDTVYSPTGASVYITVNVGGNPINGSVLFYFYKNNKVSSNNLYNYYPLLPNSTGNIVSNTKTSVLDRFDDGSFNDRSSLRSGDSVYFAVYPSASNPQSYDYLAPLDTLGYYQYTCIGSQRLVIPYKLH